MIYFIVEVITSFSEAFILYDLVSCFFQKRNTLIKKFVLSGVATVVVLYLNSFSYFSVFTLLFMPVFWGITAAVIFKIKLRHTVSIALFYSLCINIFENILVSVAGLLTGRSDFIQIIMASGVGRVTFIYIDKLLFTFIYLILRKYMVNRKEFVQNKYLFVISIGGFCGSIFLTLQTLEQINIDTAFSWLFLSIIIGLVLILAYFSIQQKYEKDALELAEIRNNLLESNYNNIKTLYETNAKLFHDFKNHIKVIDRLIDTGNSDELKEYISGFELSDKSLEATVWTEDIVVNFILNNKIEAAKQEGITVSANIDFPLKANIRSNDVTTLLANLFDNAIEACMQLSKEQERNLNVVIRQVNDMLMIKMENSCYAKPMMKENRFLTTKKNEAFHGWGLKSVESTVKKYNGSLDCNYDEAGHVFKAVLNLSFVGMDKQVIKK